METLLWQRSGSINALSLACKRASSRAWKLRLLKVNHAAEVRQRELLRSRPELVPRAIEEVLRVESAVQFFPSRSALADIEISGTVVPKGSAVFLLYGAATRDPSWFPWIQA